MAKSTVLHVRMEPELKESAERILEKLGLSSSEAVNIFYRQIIIQASIPFEIVSDNKRKNKRSSKKSLSGYLSKYANKNLIDQESGIWAKEAME